MLNKAKAKDYAYDLVLDGKYYFCQLNESEKSKLAGLLLEATPQTYVYEYISEADAKTELPYMLAKFMQNNSDDLKNDIINFMKEHAYNRMEKQIDEILKEQEENYHFNLKYEGNNNE
jgi:hypothetical protein